jgi:hypothetical protein
MLDRPMRLTIKSLASIPQEFTFPPPLGALFPPDTFTAGSFLNWEQDAEPEMAERPPKKPKLSGKGDDWDSLPAITLLSQEQDQERLKSPLHIFVRKQIEVFTATQAELSQPAPGRKRPIQLYQVGIRCIHCKHLPARERIKRAGSFPSSVSRLYHAVSDFQFDHLPNCSMLPPNVRTSFQTLKGNAKNSKRLEYKRSGKAKSTVSTSTAKYYEESARWMGMVDGKNGIFMASALQTSTSHIHSTLPQDSNLYEEQIDDSVESFSESLPAAASVDNGPAATIENRSKTQRLEVESSHRQCVFPMPLSSPKDNECLNALHVFCRKNIELFAASEEDINSPAPGRKTRPIIGQIGIRCIHCAKLTPKQRVKRSVCYPPTVAAIYHATSNMKFDHFKVCPALPPNARAEFNKLKTCCVRRGSSGSVTSASTKPSSSSTSEYYRKAAFEKGLVDSASGIRLKPEKGNSVEAPKGTTFARGKSVCAFTGLSTLALAACHAQ